jgi:hypothetical protein
LIVGQVAIPRGRSNRRAQVLARSLHGGHDRREESFLLLWRDARATNGRRASSARSCKEASVGWPRATTETAKSGGGEQKGGVSCGGCRLRPLDLRSVHVGFSVDGRRLLAGSGQKLWRQFGLRVLFGWVNWEQCSSAPCIQAPRDMRAQVVRLHRSATPGHASERSSFWLSRFGLTFAHAVVFPRGRRLGGGVRWVSLGTRARA